jgi:hypothetical protein
MERHHLLLWQCLCQRWVLHREQVICSRGSFGPCDLLWEVLDDVFDVLHHGNHHLPFGQEIKYHTKLVVDLFLVGGHSHSVLLAQLFSKNSDLIQIAV